MNGITLAPLSGQMPATMHNPHPSMQSFQYQSPSKPINISYALVIGPYQRIILFDNHHNVVGFIVGSKILSIDEADPYLTALILEPLRVPEANTPHSHTSTHTHSPTLSALSSTTVSHDSTVYNETKHNSVSDYEDSPDPPMTALTSLLSAPEYVPNNQTPKSNIISIVGNRVTLIPTISSLEKQLLNTKYFVNSKKNIRKSGLKRSRTTFQRKKTKKKSVQSRSLSCSALSVVKE